MVFTLIAAVLVSPVMAGSSVDELQELLAERHEAPPSLAMVCSPVSSLVRRLEPIVEHPLSVEASALAPSPLLNLLKSEGLARAGLVADGVLSLELWPQGAIRLRLPFDGDADQFVELTQLFAAGSSGEFPPDSGQIQIRFGEIEFGGATPVSGLFEGLPDLPGCVIYMARQTSGSGPLQQGQVALVLEIESGSGVLRAGAGIELPELEGSNRIGTLGSSLDKPETLLVLGVSLEALIESVWNGSPEPISSAHRRLVRRLGVTEGATLAMFDALGSRDFAAVLPVRGRLGLSVPPGRSRARVAKMFRVQEIPCESTSSRKLVCQIQDLAVHVAFGRSLIVFASQETLGQEVIEGRGTLWSEQLQLPREEDFAVSAAVDLRLPDSGTHVVAGMGARVEERFIETQFSIDAGLGWHLLNDRLARENHAGVLEGYRQRGWTEITGIIDELYVAQVQHELEHDTFLALETAPRAIDSLTTLSVEWDARPGWESLNWSPSHLLQGVYWVEVLENGASFTVHGACDSDGDGIAAHFSRTLGESLVQHSRPEVY